MGPKCRKCSEPIPPPPVTPLWANPAAMVAGAGAKVTRTEVPSSGNHPCAPPDPKRIAISFGVGQLGGVLFAPHSDPESGGWSSYSGNGVDPLWFYLAMHGSFVNLGWFVFAQGPCFVYVYELYRLK